MINSNVHSIQTEHLTEESHEVKFLNSVFPPTFAEKYGKKWVRITYSDKTTEIRLSALIQNGKNKQWFEGKLNTRIWGYAFDPKPDGLFQLVVQEPIRAISNANSQGLASGYGTVFCRFPHMYSRMMEIPLLSRTGAHVLVVGPGFISARDQGETNPKFQDAVYFPQLFELLYLFPGAYMTAMDKAGPVLDALRLKFSTGVHVMALEGVCKAALTTFNTFSRNVEKYENLAEIMRGTPKDPAKVSIMEGDITKIGSNAKFDVIVATKVLRYIPQQYAVESPEEGREIAIKALSHLFSALESGGKLYVDEESINILVGISNTDLDQLLEIVRKDFHLASIACKVVHHDATREKDGLYWIESPATTKKSIGMPTDNIHEFTLLPKDEVAPPS